MERPIVAVDLDEVVWDIIKPMLMRYNLRYNDNVRLEDITEWDFQDILKPECKDFFAEFSTEGLLTDLVIKPEIVASLTFLSMVADVYFVTASWAETLMYKKQVLEKYLKWFTDNMLVKLERKELFRCDYLIDDNEENVRRCKGTALLIDKPWNKCSDLDTYTTVGAILKITEDIIGGHAIENH